MSQQVCSFLVNIVSDNSSFGVDTSLCMHELKKLCSFRSRCSAHVKDNIVWFSIKKKWWDHRNEFLSRNKTCISSSLKVLMESFKQCWFSKLCSVAIHLPNELIGIESNVTDLHVSQFSVWKLKTRCSFIDFFLWNIFNCTIIFLLTLTLILIILLFSFFFNFILLSFTISNIFLFRLDAFCFFCFICYLLSLWFHKCIQEIFILYVIQEDLVIRCLLVDSEYNR